MNAFLEIWQDPPRRKKWLRQHVQEPFFGALGWPVHHLLRHLPLDLNAKLGAALGEAAGKYYLKGLTARVERNIALLRPDLDPATVHQLALEQWRHVGRARAEYSVLDRLYANRRLSVENDEPVRQFARGKRAVIFLFMHTGNWELGGGHLADLGFDVISLYKPVSNRFSQRLADRARQRLRELTESSRSSGKHRYLDTNEPGAMRKVCKHLAEHGALCIAMDEAKGGQVRSPSFGRGQPPSDTNLAYAVRLARRYDAVLVPGWGLRQADARFSLRGGEPIAVADTDQAAADALLALDSQLEQWIRANLGQWYMLHQLRL